jgi:hypothetical protein
VDALSLWWAKWRSMRILADFCPFLLNEKVRGVHAGRSTRPVDLSS